MVLNSIVGRRLAVTYQQVDNAIIQRCKASSASPQPKSSIGKNTDRSVEELEWNEAKPFDDIPGFRVLPVMGTLWGMLPVVGTSLSN